MQQDAFQRIMRAQADYVRCIDQDRLEAWPDFFTEDCFYKITSAENHRLGMEAGLVWADNRRMLQDRASALRNANIYERQAYRHMLGQPWVAEETESGAVAETAFMVLRITRDGPTDLFASGVYLDRYRFEAGATLLAERVVVLDSSRIDTLLALPL